MFGGSTVGKILAMKPPTELVLEWRFQNWREGDVSKVWHLMAPCHSADYLSPWPSHCSRLTNV